MPKAARVMDTTAHGVPMQGSGSPDVFIGNMKAWRAMPAGVGAGLDQASKDTKAIMDVKPNPVEAFILMQVKPKVAKIKTAMEQVAGQVESETKKPGARASVKAAFLTLEATGTALDAVYQVASKAPAPGAEAAARAAFTIGYQKALAAAMSASVASLAGPWDMHTCAAPGPNPHGPGFVMKGCQTVFINNLPAVMEGQELMEAAGGPNAIKVGCGTVIIGDKAPAGSGGSAKGKADGAKHGSPGKAGPVSAKDEGKGGDPDKGAAANQPVTEEVEMLGSYQPAPVSVRHGYIVPDMLLIPQMRDMACWFASAQMLIDWRRRKANGTPLANPDPSQVKTSVGWEVNNHGITNPLVIQLAKLLGLKTLVPQSLSLKAVEGLLKAYGPLWTNGTSHIVVIAGVDLDNGSLLVYDPWPPGKGKIEWREYGWYLDSPKPDSRDTSADVRAVFLRLP